MGINVAAEPHTTGTQWTAGAGSTQRQPYEILRGHRHPMGATVDAEGVNFSIFSQHATAVELLLFDKHDDPDPVQIIRLDPRSNRAFPFWHVYVKGLRPGAHYAYRIDGPFEPSRFGHRYDRDKVLLDAYAHGITTHLWERASACRPGSNLATSMRCAVIDTSDYDWEGDCPLNHLMSDTIIYEMHVGGFTKSPTSACQNPGTFAGVVEKIPYLKELGVTAVELMPVFEFDQSEIDRTDPTTGRQLSNYWGYSPVGFFSPESAYCITPDDGNHIREFRDMVKALHRADIEVYLDVVFNHTGEGDHRGPVISFKGLDNSIYYDVVESDRQYYMDYTGCGNTFDCNHPIAEKLILESLEFWVKEMHVDGFRFDEASILARGPDGVPMTYPPVVWHIETSEILADTKVFAEAWDAAGLYQLGYFPGYRWAEWNGRFRDDVRQFVRGDRGKVASLGSRLAGSADIYESTGHLPINSVNFIDCHDGFTLNDLVSYNQKHNEANGEGNRDGNDNNLSWNCGAEGPTDDQTIEALRERQIRNFATILFFSRGVPMFVMGDEVRRTQRGNNNAYCQDNELSWFDWSLVNQHPDMFRFFKEIIAFRMRHPAVHRHRFFTSEVNERGLNDIAWHGCALLSPGWHDPNSRVLACTIAGYGGDADLHFMANMDDQDLDFEIPTVANRSWYRSVDTALPSPEDIVTPGMEPIVSTNHYRVQGRSVAILISKERALAVAEPQELSPDKSISESRRGDAPPARGLL